MQGWVHTTLQCFIGSITYYNKTVNISLCLIAQGMLDDDLCVGIFLQSPENSNQIIR